jgi:hypothetical protein
MEHSMKISDMKKLKHSLSDLFNEGIIFMYVYQSL